MDAPCLAVGLVEDRDAARTEKELQRIGLAHDLRHSGRAAKHLRFLVDAFGFLPRGEGIERGLCGGGELGFDRPASVAAEQDRPIRVPHAGEIGPVGHFGIVLRPVRDERVLPRCRSGHACQRGAGSRCRPSSHPVHAVLSPVLCAGRVLAPIGQSQVTLDRTALRVASCGPGERYETHACRSCRPGRSRRRNRDAVRAG